MSKLKLKSWSTSPCICNFLKRFCCHNRFVLIIFSLFCAIIVLTQQAVALTYPIPRQPAEHPESWSSSLASSSSESLVSQLKQSKTEDLAFDTSYNEADDVLTPGQLVINAVPDQERGDFIMYELITALQETNDVVEENLETWQKNLEVLKQDYRKKLSDLENGPIYENFSHDLLLWLQETFNLTHYNVYNQLRSRSPMMCTASGVCYNSNKIGCYCCPF